MGLTHRELGSNATAGVTVALIEGLNKAAARQSSLLRAWAAG